MLKQEKHEATNIYYINTMLNSYCNISNVFKYVCSCWIYKWRLNSSSNIYLVHYAIVNFKVCSIGPASPPL